MLFALPFLYQWFLIKKLKIKHNHLKYMNRYSSLKNSDGNHTNDFSLNQIGRHAAMMSWIIWLTAVISLNPVKVFWDDDSRLMRNLIASCLDDSLTNVDRRINRLYCNNDIVWFKMSKHFVEETIYNYEVSWFYCWLHGWTFRTAKWYNVLVEQVICCNCWNHH